MHYLTLFVAVLSVCSFIALLNGVSAANSQIDLSTNWTLTNSNRSITLNNLKIPISVQNALRDAHIIDDPFYRYNDVAIRWIGYDSWTFVKHFNVNQKLANVINNATAQLVFNQLDTIATVYLNGHFVLFAQNQFLKYSVSDLYSMLTVGDNELKIVFKSPVKYAQSIADIYPYEVPPVCPPDTQHGECHVNFLRKQQCSFSWDWGPAMISIGINDAIYLNLINNFDFNHSISIYPPSNSSDLSQWIIDAQLDVFLNLDATVGSVQISIPELKYMSSDTRQFNSSENRVYYKPNIDAQKYGIQFWYPNGYGDQKLYNITISCTIANITITKWVMSAFRKVELVQKPVAENVEGLSFYFKINNIPVFFKGSNWIPIDPFEDRVNQTYLKWLLTSVADANMNVLRVWGGGQYETKEFYELADQLGIMIWQDFMFACAAYPTNDDYLENVNKEVEYQVSRLRHHPSIVVWAGNNENEAAISTNWYGTSFDRTLYSNDYRKLYIGTIRNKLLQIDPEISRPFVSSSPTNGLESEQENWLAADPYDVRFGDLHFYNYYIDSWNPKSYPIARFTSEYGFQSLPSFSTLSTAYDVNHDMALFSDLNDHRQHHGLGNQQLLYQITDHFNEPGKKSVKIDELNNFQTIIYLTQIGQGMSLKTAAEVYRRSRDKIDESGIGMCYGFMYWQLNDVWQAPTWSSIEYGGKWKLGHYLVKKAFASILISPYVNEDTKTVEVMLISDQPKEAVQDSIVFTVYGYTDFTIRYQKTVGFQINPLTSQLVLEIGFDKIESETGCKYNDANAKCLMTFTFQSGADFLKDGENFLFSINKINQTDITNTVNVSSVSKLSDNSFSIQLQSPQVALYVWLEINDNKILGKFSENGFHMTTASRTVIYYTLNSGFTVNDIRNSLSVSSLIQK